MAWQQLRDSAAADDADWPTLGTVPDAAIVAEVHGAGKVPSRGLKFCMVWTDDAGEVVAGAGSATATLVEVVDTAPFIAGGERAFAGESTAVEAAKIYAFDGLSDGRFALRLSSVTPPGGATRYRVFWGVF